MLASQFNFNSFNKILKNVIYNINYILLYIDTCYLWAF